MSKEKVHFSVARNMGHTRKSIGFAERHNERKNFDYGNPDIDTTREEFNVYFKECDTTYIQKFDQMIDSGELSTRGLRDNANIFGELVFDVNTEYFEIMGEKMGIGGYEYAKQFYQEAYNFAIKEIGNENYIMGAVMHADEKNQKISQELGKDVYHYHMHVSYIPVVDKDIKYSKRCKDPELRGKIKESIKQVSHGNKWNSEKFIDENGKQKMNFSYSKLQDKFHDHMKNAGFDGFDRGQYKSTAQHLENIEYKAKMEQERLQELQAEIKPYEQAAVNIREIDAIDKGKMKTKSGRDSFAPEDSQRLVNSAKNSEIYKTKSERLENELNEKDAKLDELICDVVKTRLERDKFRKEATQLSKLKTGFDNVLDKVIEEMPIGKTPEAEKIKELAAQAVKIALDTKKHISLDLDR